MQQSLTFAVAHYDDEGVVAEEAFLVLDDVRMVQVLQQLGLHHA